MGYPPPNYQYPPPMYPVSTSGWAIFSLIAGILGWVGVFGLGGIVAIIAGYIAKNEINNSQGRVGGSGLATTGLVLGWANVILSIVLACLGVLMFAGILATPAFCPDIFKDINIR